MDNIHPLKIFILLIIDKINGRNNTYGLIRIFARSSVLPDELSLTLSQMVEEKLIEVVEIRNAVKYYKVVNREMLGNTSPGILKPYLNTIDPSGSYVHLLDLMLESKLSWRN